MKGTAVTFKDGKAIVELADGSRVLSVVKSGSMYIVKIVQLSLEAFIAQSNWKPTSFDTWYWCLAYTGADTVHEMISKQLVDGLHIDGDLSIRGQCEDCIYGKHTSRPYNENVAKENDVLE